MEHPKKHPHMMEGGYEYSKEDSYRYSKLAMTWHGWGSALGLGLFFVCCSLSVYLLSLAGLF